MNVDEVYKVLVAIRDKMIDVDYEGYQRYDEWLQEGKWFLVEIFKDQLERLENE